MPWKATQTVHIYKPGDVVPDKQAEHWVKVFVTPPVKWFNDNEPEQQSSPEKEPEEVKYDDTDVNKDGKTDLKDVMAVVRKTISKKGNKRSRGKR